MKGGARNANSIFSCFECLKRRYEHSKRPQSRFRRFGALKTTFQTLKTAEKLSWRFRRPLSSQNLIRLKTSLLTVTRPDLVLHVLELSKRRFKRSKQLKIELAFPAPPFIPEPNKSQNKLIDGNYTSFSS